MSKFTDFLTDCAVLAAIIGLASKIFDPSFPRNGLVAIAFLGCVLIGSVFVKRILEAMGWGIEAFFEKLPFRKKDPIKKAQKAQADAEVALRKLKQAESKTANSTPKVDPGVLNKKSEFKTPDLPKIERV